MAEGIDLRDVDLSGINWYPDVKSHMAIPGMRSAVRLQEQAQEAAQAAYEQDWEWREQQSELLAALIERQDAMAEEQRRQAEEQRAADKGSKAREITVIVLTALGILVSVLFATGSAIINTLAQ